MKPESFARCAGASHASGRDTARPRTRIAGQRGPADARGGAGDDGDGGRRGQLPAGLRVQGAARVAPGPRRRRQLPPRRGPPRRAGTAATAHPPLPASFRSHASARAHGEPGPRLQIECSDTILINKIDLVKGDKALASLRAIVSSFNPMAECLAVEQGRCPMHVLFDRKRPALMAGLTSEGQHKGAVAAARAADVGGACDHAHGGEGPCTTCDARRGRGGATTAAVRFGITSFVYERRRPFHPQRLRRTVLRWLPSTAALKPSAGDAAEDAAQGQPGDSPLQRVLRSKGFCWMSNSHSKAYFWSHAGQHFEMRDEGDWWASVPEAEWPADAAGRLSIARDFDLAAYAPDGGARADVALPPGDRRQEVVFIGAGMDEAAIASALDECLLTDDELALYHENWGRLRDPGGESVRAAVAQAIAQKQAAQS
ncbi:unnamed protein product [Pedinophyceae sp. YPF-701]|nr:unnamed protein product [Pedinophyceae sp. YPF-701]